MMPICLLTNVWLLIRLEEDTVIQNVIQNVVKRRKY